MRHLNLEHARIIADNREACEFLLSENALSGLVPTAPYDTVTGFWYSADTHSYCFASYSRVPGDTGYLVILFPVAHYTDAEAAAISNFLTEANRLRPGGVVYEEDLAHPKN